MLRVALLAGSVALLTLGLHLASSVRDGRDRPDASVGIAASAVVPAFSGPLDTPEAIRALDAFLAAYSEHPAIRLDVSLPDSTAASLGPDDMNRYYVDLAYGERDSRMGSELLVLLDEGPAAEVHVTRTPRPLRLVACLRYKAVTGPRQGLMSYAMAPLPATRCR